MKIEQVIRVTVPGESVPCKHDDAEFCEGYTWADDGGSGKMNLDASKCTKKFPRYGLVTLTDDGGTLTIKINIDGPSEEDPDRTVIVRSNDYELKDQAFYRAVLAANA